MSAPRLAGDTGKPDTVVLLEEEKRVIAELVRAAGPDRISQVGDDAWIARTAELSASLPPALAGALRAFRRDSGADGTLLIRGIRLDEARLPPTPVHAEAAEWTRSAPAVLAMLLSLALGEVTAFREEKGGALVQGVVPVPGREEEQGNTGSVELTMHTENAFHPHRPDFVLLLCLRSDHDRRAGLRVASVRRALPLLDEKTVEVLSADRFVTGPPASFGRRATGVRAHPILIGCAADPDVRVDFTSTFPLDTEAEAAMAELCDTLDRVSTVLYLEPGDLAIVDNRISLHGRTSFTPRYDGADRWLLRTFVHLDLRRSRALRPGGGSVLISENNQ